MEFNIFSKIHLTESFRKKSWWTDAVFYFFWGLLAAILIFYAIFAYKAYRQRIEINNLDGKIIAYSTDRQKEQERIVFEYRKKVDDFAVIIAQHKITSNILDFMEKNTLPNVWFLTFSMSQPANLSSQMNLSGEAENMESLTKQYNVFERDKENVTSLSGLNSTLGLEGKAKFNFNLSLSQKLLNYVPSAKSESAALPDINKNNSLQTETQN
ncbi:MAG: hypothetical protein AAB877_02600 [Patescibacteria group bacterium]